ncbi:MAG: hypothetical protein KGJ23_07430 [Euryarchaeota archaeon]|nr:hypothetical protein [Euryarchaeota archaeon]MDE1836430.1 hypothetical protein [Euryarchaeota archaeon]MDE1879055.1 hypothetical protein [Euryarchaeota archaeon]MDE2044178.1 hypothetical protein [Thermoplasmata archaeon]
MSADLGSFLTALFTDPVYGLPLLIWAIVGIVWLLWGHGSLPPALLPYRAHRVRSVDPVSSMYWALAEKRYSETLLFAYQRLDAAFQRRYGISIRFIPWRRKHQLRYGIEDPKPFERAVRLMVKTLDGATTLEGKPAIRAVAHMLRPYRERKMLDRFHRVMSDLDWMLPFLEGSA